MAPKANLERKQNPLILELLELGCDKFKEAGGTTAAPAVFASWTQNLQQSEFSPEVPLIQLLVEDGFIDVLQFGQGKLRWKQLKSNRRVLKLVAQSLQKTLSQEHSRRPQ